MTRCRWCDRRGGTRRAGCRPRSRRACGADDEAGHDAARVDPLEAVGDDAALDEIDDAVGEHLGVDAEIVLVMPRRARTASGMAPMPIWSVEPSSTRAATSSPMRARSTSVAGSGWCSYERAVGVDEGVDAIERHHGVAVRARHLLVDLGDDDARGGGGLRPAALAASHEVPSEQWPWRRGGETWTGAGGVKVIERPRDVERAIAAAVQEEPDGMSERKTGLAGRLEAMRADLLDDAGDQARREVAEHRRALRGAHLAALPQRHDHPQRAAHVRLLRDRAHVTGPQHAAR
jgi:hypothetical protein